MTEAPLTALVTGSGRNIGRAIAIDLAARGMRIVVHGNRNRESAEETAATVRAAGRDAVVALGDLGERRDVIAIAEQAIAAYRESKKAMQTAREGEGLAVTEMAVLTQGRRFMQQMLEQLISAHPEAQKGGPARGDAPAERTPRSNTTRAKSS